MRRPPILIALYAAFALAGCGGATPKPPEARDDTARTPGDAPDGEAGNPDSRAATDPPPPVEGKMVDVPGDDAADLVPQCDDKDACNNMGVFAAMGGKGAVAQALLQKACDMGNGTGCSNLANLLVRGELLPRDDERAALLDQQACRLGEAKGCTAAGLEYLEGVGVATDRAKALEYLAMACDKGDAESCRMKDELAPKTEAAPSGPSAGVPEANLTVGSMTVNDMTVNDLECKVSGMGFMAAMQLVGAIAAQKKAMDRCEPKGGAPRVTWTFTGGTATEIRVDGASSVKVEKCVAKAAAAMRSSMSGICSAYFLIGKAQGAKAAYDAAKQPK